MICFAVKSVYVQYYFLLFTLLSLYINWFIFSRKLLVSLLFLDDDDDVY